MSHLAIDDYIVGVTAFLVIFAVMQVALYAGRHRGGAPARKD